MKLRSLSVALALVACAGDPIVVGDASPDARADASLEAASDVAADVAPDVTVDVTPDVTVDVAPDTAPDVTADAAPDVTADASPDAAPDVTADAAPDVTTDAADAMPADAAADVAADLPIVNGCPSYVAPIDRMGAAPGGDTWAAFARDFFQRLCVRCHSTTLRTAAERMGAPDGYDWDDMAAVQRELPRIRAAVGVNNYMPLTPPLATCEERRRLVRWIDIGAP